MRQAQEITLSEAATHIRNTSKRHVRPFFFMVGAGISYPPIPLAPEIIEACRTECGSCDAPEVLNPMGEYSWWFQKAFHSPADRQLYLRGLIGNSFVSQANLRLAHLLLSKRIGNLVITTNFDDFVAKSLTIFGEPYIVCDHPETIQRIDPESDDLQIVHVHGTYWFYDCCNLAGEVEARSKKSPQTASSMADFLDRVLNSRSPLVLGYSGWEDDVFMTALKRRLKRVLPYNLYWFCYQRNLIANLPNDLIDHPNVFFVVPEVANSGSESRGRVRARGASRKPGADEKTGEPRLAATQVLDALVASLALDAPPLTRDPLRFFAEHLRRSLPPDEASNARPDPYLIRKVIRRIERASQSLTAAEQRLESVRDAVRRSQYGEAIGRASVIVDADLDEDQIRELVEIPLLAGSKLVDSSAEELAAYERVIESGDDLLRQFPEDSGIKQCVAKALVNRANALGSTGKTTEALLIYDQVVSRFETSTESALQYQVARSIYNKAVTCYEAKDTAASLGAYRSLVERFADRQEGDIRGLIAWALYNQAAAHDELGQSGERQKLYNEVVDRFDRDTLQDGREVVVLETGLPTTLSAKRRRSGPAAMKSEAGRASLRPRPISPTLQNATGIIHTCLALKPIWTSCSATRCVLVNSWSAP